MTLAITPSDARAFQRKARDGFSIGADPQQTEAIFGADPLDITRWLPAVTPEAVDLEQKDQGDHRWQVAQHLQDLGYLPTSSHEPSNTDIAQALSQFDTDAARFTEQFAWHGDPKDIDPPPESAEMPPPRHSTTSASVTYTQLRRLNMLTAFDGELRLLSLPKAGETSLRSRFTLFRLQTYNLLPATLDTSSPFPPDALEPLVALSELLQPETTPPETSATALSMLNQLGQAPLLADLYLQAVPASGAWIRTRKNPIQRRRAFGHVLNRNRSRSQSLRLPLLQAFALELLQMLLWMNDYYLGEVDLDWGPESRKALKRFAKAEEIPVRQLLRPHRVNARVAIGLLARHEKRDTDVFEAQDEIADQIARTFDQGGVDSWQRIQKTLDKRDREQRKKRRRRYFGIGRLVHAIGKLAKNVARWVSQLLSNLFGPLLKFVRFLGRAIRTTLRIADLALKRIFLLVSRKPLLSGSLNPPRLVATSHGFGNDIKLMVATEGEAEWIERHFELVAALNRALGWVLAIAQAALQFARGPLGWFRGAYQLFTTVRQIFEYTPSTPFQAPMLWS